jgi:hypothetical protein
MLRFWFGIVFSWCQQADAARTVWQFSKCHKRRPRPAIARLSCARLVRNCLRRGTAQMGATTRRFLERKLRLVGRLGLILSLVTCTIAGDAPATNAQNAPAEKVMLERGRVLELELQTSVSSESANGGDHLQLKLLRPVMSGGTIVLPVGWIVPAHVTKVRRAGKRNCRDGNVAWKIDAGVAADGTKVRLVGLPGDPSSPYGSPVGTVHLKTTGDKAGRVFDDVLIAPIFAVEMILFLPWGIAMARGEGQPCGGQSGSDINHPAGVTLYAAVAKSVRITVNTPATH